MEQTVEMRIIARIRGDFDSKFGLPRQSGLVPALRSAVVFEPPYRDEDAVRGLSDYSHLWLLWCFSESIREGWTATVRPPRLGGNRRMGVFATRSPFRPNPIGLSSVSLKEIVFDEKEGPILIIEGADLMDGTPIFDIKPYLAFTDSHPEARGGFTADIAAYRLDVVFPAELLAKVPAEKRAALQGVLAEDPRPAYHEDPSRRYGLSFAGLDIGFKVKEKTLTVVDVKKTK
ncbi:MAG: tRNA (N6-threonylcarbamoyladenosine(37)-N6)-methyltransferase TrmO [Bacillota bacterium]|jgi:tRNA-Thr(GGU) m(6)t(6)A37 methyltransferase TsaA